MEQVVSLIVQFQVKQNFMMVNGLLNVKLL